MRIFDLTWGGGGIGTPTPMFRGQLYFPLNDGLIGTELHCRLRRFIYVLKLSK